KCGGGRGVREGGGGERLEVPLVAARTHAVSGRPDEVRSLSTLVLEQLAAAGGQPREVVLDVGPAGLRALLSFIRGEESDLVACTAQEGIGLPGRRALGLYATPEALALQ